MGQLWTMACRKRKGGVGDWVGRCGKTKPSVGLTRPPFFISINTHPLWFSRSWPKLSFIFFIKLNIIFALVSYTVSSDSLLCHSSHSILTIFIHCSISVTAVKLEVSLAFLTGVLGMSIEMVFQIVKAGELLVTMLTGKWLLSFVYI